MPTTLLEWRWAIDAATNRTRAGFCAAMVQPQMHSGSRTALKPFVLKKLR